MRRFAPQVVFCLLSTAYCLLPTAYCHGQDTKTLPKWTCIVYLAGDNFLDWFTQQNLEELKEAGRGVLSATADLPKARQYAPTYDVRTVVLADKMDKGGHLYEVRNGYLLELPVEDINPSWKNKELNTGDPQTLITFAAWAVENLPAQNYLLLLGGYGEGWMGMLHDLNDGSASGGVDVLSLPELEEALGSIVRAIKRVNGKDRIDILGLDACYMAMVEVLFSIKDYAHYVIASENEEALDGWPYGDVLRAFLEDPSKPAPQIASRIADAYVDTTSYLPTKLDNILTVAVIDLTALTEIMPPLGELALTLKSAFGGSPQAVKRFKEVDTLTDSFTVSAHIAGRYIPYSMHYDLGSFLNALRLKFRDNQAVSKKAIELQKALKKVVIRERHQDLTERKLHLGGLTLFSMGAELEGYKELPFARNNPWYAFVEERVSTLGGLEKTAK
ncbi:MAG: clostripain-related cysteine peptidase [Candidatus Brocadiaceae bacterium]|nr:clostripain-related cysteine peptidase [Candidatus Brocadiaceae bacterium]